MPKTNRETQADRLLRCLQAVLTYRNPEYRYVSLVEIMGLGIANYTARISELRKRLRPQGMDIICKKETVDRQVRTTYWLIRRSEAA